MALSFTKLKTMFGDLSQNSSTANLTRGGDLMNIEHRYLLQKYFNNEGQFQITTLGTQTLTLTASVARWDTSATLSSAWTLYTTILGVTFSSGEFRLCKVEAGGTSITWNAALTKTGTATITAAVQFYPLPPNYSKLKTVTITVGNLKWTPKEVLTRKEWDEINVFPYYADIPNDFFIYQGQLGIWPIPATTGNLITFNYKFRVPDLALEDYTTPGTITLANNGTAITGSSTTFAPTTNPVLESRWIQFAPTSSTSTSGDNLWYQLASIDSATAATLYNPYQGTALTSTSSYTIGQMPLLMEDFHDMLLWKALSEYFNTIVDKPDKVKEFQALYLEKLKMLEDYAGSKTINVNLGRQTQNLNPNLFGQSFGQ